MLELKTEGAAKKGPVAAFRSEWDRSLYLTKRQPNIEEAEEEK